jgi:redox-sensitive bicupin YhaK (pirin superfamily)
MPGIGMNRRLVIGLGSGPVQANPFIALMNDDVPAHAMFPTHPHQWVEIVTSGVADGLYHEDTLDNRGTVVAGDAERNLSGRGFAHSEQPVGSVPYRGFQLFIGLTEADRNAEPTRQPLNPDEIPEVRHVGTCIRVVTDTVDGATSPTALRNLTQYLDVRVDPGHTIDIPVPTGYADIAYAVEGSGTIGTPPVTIDQYQRVSLGDGATLHLACLPDAAAPFRAVIVSGRPFAD